MDSDAPWSSMGSTAAMRMSTRRRPLHTCGVSMAAIARNASKRVQDRNEPIGSLVNKTVKLAASTSLFVYLQFQWLALLSFIDDHILAIEKSAETLFPPSSYVFDKIDDLVHIVEWLPGKFDEAANKFPLIIHQVPFLEWAILYAVSWLNFVVSIFTSCESDRTREKDIMIDMNCNDGTHESALIVNGEHLMESPAYSCEDMGNFPLTSDNPKADTNINEAGITKCTYKEILEKGAKVDTDIKHNITMEETEKSIPSKEETEGIGEKHGNKTNESIAMDDDPILDLFESAWHMKPGRGGNASPMACSNISFA